MVQKIEELEQRQKSAFLRLYERVGQEIGTNMNKTLQEREKEILAEQAANEELSSSELEMKRLKQAQDNAAYKMKNESVTLNDLFNKYNI